MLAGLLVLPLALSFGVDWERIAVAQSADVENTLSRKKSLIDPVVQGKQPSACRRKWFQKKTYVISWFFGHCH